MKRYISYVVTGLALLSLSACNREVFSDSGFGFLELNMESDLSADVIVKAGTDEPVYAIDVKNTAGQLVAHANDHRTVTTANPIRLYVGTYNVYATSGSKLNAAFNAPYYEGSTQIRILPDYTSTASIKCTLANTIFSVEFPADFAASFTKYSVSVTNGTGEKLTLSNAPEAGNSNEAGFDAKAYFAVTGTLTWELYLCNKDGGEYRSSHTFENVKAKSHYHLSFSIGEESEADGAFSINVSLDDNMSDSSHDVVLDFDNRNLPDVSSTGEMDITSGEPMTVPVGNTAEKELSVSTPEGLVSFQLIHNDEGLKSIGLSENIEFVGISSEDEAALASLGISATQIVGTKAVTKGAEGIKLNLTNFIAKLAVGQYNLSLRAIDGKSHSKVFDLALDIISDVDAEAVRANTGWAAFAQLEGRFFKTPAPAGMTFQYRESGSQQWTSLSPSMMDINISTLRYTAIIKGLKPQTTYEFRAISDKDNDTDKIVQFTTSAAETLHNFSFDNWTQEDKMPNAEGFAIWDSANSTGAATTTKPTDDAVRGKAARLESVTAFGMLAAGNIFTGKFVGLQGLGAKLDWGVPFTSRPLALRGYYKYQPKTIDKAKDPYTDKKGQTDQSQILIFLTDWTGPFRVNTSNKEFVDYDNDPGIIALGQLNTSNTDSGYVRFTLPLIYRSNRIPTYIVVAAASSRFGDYFTGGVGSVLMIDEFELVYDPDDLSTDEFNTVFSKVEAF